MCVGGVEIVDGSGVQAEQRQWGMARSREKGGRRRWRVREKRKTEEEDGKTKVGARGSRAERNKE